MIFHENFLEDVTADRKTCANFLLKTGKKNQIDISDCYQQEKKKAILESDGSIYDGCSKLKSELR